MKNKHVYGRDTYREIKSFQIGHLVHEKHTTQNKMPNLKTDIDRKVAQLP